jgi:hypothetical protein
VVKILPVSPQRRRGRYAALLCIFAEMVVYLVCSWRETPGNTLVPSDSDDCEEGIDG